MIPYLCPQMVAQWFKYLDFRNTVTTIGFAAMRYFQFAIHHSKASLSSLA